MIVIELLLVALMKLTLPLALVAWGVLLAVGNPGVAAVAVPCLLLLVSAVERSGRLRGKRAEGGP
jgi:hypothetical protein